MGALVVFDEIVGSDDARGRNDRKCSVEVVDCYGTPEIRIGPEAGAEKGWTAEFKDWNQYTRFVQGLVDLHKRLNGGRSKIMHS